VFCVQLDTWPELKEFVDSFDMKALEQDSRAHSHVPYLVIIAHKIREWQLGHGGAMPGTYEEKRAFKASIEQGRLASNTDVREQECGFTRGMGCVRLFVPTM
jgi:hypothetical protein